MSLRRVVLPEPLGPTMQRFSPGHNSKSTSRKAQLPEKLQPVRSRRSSIWGKYLLRRLIATAGVDAKKTSWERNWSGTRPNPASPGSGFHQPEEISDNIQIPFVV